jgi:hypothetical protein
MLVRLDQITLEPEQQDLLCLVVEASRSLARDQREKFLLLDTADGYFLRHPYLPNFLPNVYKGDIELLHRVGLVHALYEGSTLVFDVTREGFRYYENLKGREAEPVRRVGSHTRNYIEADQFQRLYSVAFSKWKEAESLLWDQDSEKQLTTIGLRCREAMQEFATALVERHKPTNVDANKAHDVARIRSIIGSSSGKVAGTTSAFLDALVVYWGTLSDLVQRQVHGSQKEGQPLVWEDARRLVVCTLHIFAEVDRAMSFRS